MKFKAPFIKSVLYPWIRGYIVFYLNPVELSTQFYKYGYVLVCWTLEICSIINSKSEVRNPKQIRITQNSKFKMIGLRLTPEGDLKEWFWTFEIRFLKLFRISRFDIRIFQICHRIYEMVYLVNPCVLFWLPKLCKKNTMLQICSTDFFGL